MIVDELKNAILNFAFNGKLVENDLRVNNKYSYEDIKNQQNLLKKEKKVIFNKVSNESSIIELYDIPKNWSWIKLGDIVFNWGQKKPSTDFSYIDISSIDNLNHTLSNEEKIISPNKAPSRARKILKDDDIIYSTVRPYLHNMCIINKKFSQEPIASTGFAVMHCIDYVYNKYLFYYLMSPYFDSYVNSNEISVGIAYPAINDKKLYNANVPLPPLEEQQRIVDKIDKLFEKLDEIKPIEEELIHIKEIFPIEMKNSILKEAFDGKYSLDDNWHNDKLSNVCNEICTGNSISESIKKNKYTNIESGYNYIGTKDLNFNHIFNYENGVKIPFDEPNFKYANIGDILLCIEGGSAGKKIGILTEKVCYGNKLCKFSSTKLNSKFLYYYLQSPQFTRNFYDNLSGIIGGVSINKIRTIEISFPSIDEQQRIVNKIDELLSLVDDIEKLVGDN